MSFTQTAVTVIRDRQDGGANLDTLERVARERGLSLHRDQKTYSSHDGPRRCDMALRDTLGCPREIGLIAQRDTADGEVYYRAEWDYYAISHERGGEDLQRRVGRNLGAFSQAYNREAYKENLVADFGSGEYHETERPDGAIDIDFRTEVEMAESDLSVYA